VRAKHLYIFEMTAPGKRELWCLGKIVSKKLKKGGGNNFRKYWMCLQRKKV